MRLVFCGTPEFAVPTLTRLLGEPGFHVEAVVTQPDRQRGRGLASSFSPVKTLAVANHLAVYQPEKIRSDEAFAFFERIQPDAVVILAYGQIIPARLIALPRLGWINAHASLLPRYRGAAPIAWAIANGETRTGLTTMQIDAGMDTGPTLLRKELEIAANETAPQLSARMAEAGAPLIVETLRALDERRITPQPQDPALASYAPMLKREDGRIDWSMTAQRIYNRIRGFDTWPGAYSHFRGQRCHLWSRGLGTTPRDSSAIQAQPGTIEIRGDTLEVVCGGNTLLALDALQVEGRKRVSVREFQNGARLKTGERFE